jgi:hypothetical protein
LSEKALVFGHRAAVAGSSETRPCIAFIVGLIP